MVGKLDRLRRFNLVMAGLHALQGVVILALATGFTVPLILNFLAFDTSSQSLVPAFKAVADVPLALLVVVFLFMSALAHLTVATVGRRRYERGLRQGINRFRWVEYAFSAGTMMVAIAMLVGIYDAAALALIFLAVAVMNLSGLVMEAVNRPDRHAAKAGRPQRVTWLPFWVGALAGIAPWIAVALYLVSGAAYGSKAPDFVYWIFVSIFVFFNCFALNMVLQYKQVGKWRDYLYGERVYVLLSLFAKSALAWQVFAGTLRP